MDTQLQLSILIIAYTPRGTLPPVVHLQCLALNANVVTANAKAACCYLANKLRRR